MGIDPKIFVSRLNDMGVGLYAGVPDSLLSDLCAYLQDYYQGRLNHVITANEGNAIALAAGFHLASGKLGVVYMQNSGLGNAINPLTSLADPEVYRIPMILVIGWRGQPGVSDEPQHIKQGRITKAQLDLLEIPNWTINKNSDLESVILTARNVLLESQAPIAFLVEKGTFTKYSLSDGATPELGMTREDAIRLIISQLGAEDLLISTTGKASREVYECRQAKGEHLREFLTVGSMGHTLSIAAGVAIASRSKRVVCLDGDGSMLMHMGSLPVTASLKLENLIHIVLNNGAHESVGGQPTIARRIDLAGISNACGYARYFRADNPRELESVLSKSVGVAGPLFIEVVCSVGSRDDLGRPKSSPVENKAAFMEFARER